MLRSFVNRIGLRFLQILRVGDTHGSIMPPSGVSDLPVIVVPVIVASGTGGERTTTLEASDLRGSSHEPIGLGVQAFRSISHLLASDIEAAQEVYLRLRGEWLAIDPNDEGASFDYEFQNEVYRHLPEVVEHIIGTWVQKVMEIELDVFCSTSCWFEPGFCLRYAFPDLVREPRTWEALEAAWNNPRYLDLLLAFKRLVESEMVVQGGPSIVPGLVDNAVAALTSEAGRRFDLTAFIRLYWDEIVAQHRSTDPEARYVDAALTAHGATESLLFFLSEQALGFGLVDIAYRDGPYVLTLDGYRYLFHRVLGLPSVILPERNGDDMLGTLPFSDPRSLAVVSRDALTGEVHCRPLGEAFRFTDPSDADRFAEMIGEITPCCAD